MKPDESGRSRRQFLHIGGAIAAASAVAAHSPSREGAGLAPLSLDPNRRILLKGGTIISMDPSVGDFAQGDILIQGKKIAAVGLNVKLSGPPPRVIAASNTILIPGFIDCHRHSWEGVLRRIIPNGDIAKYTATTHRGFAPYYRPHDIYVGNLITALGCIDAGITCIIDNSHNSRSSAHSDAAVQALFDSGIRAVHASGAPQTGNWDHQWPQDLERLQKRYFSSDDQLVTLRMFSGLDRANWALARKLGLRITTEFQGAPSAMQLEQFWNEKLLGPDITYNHCGGLTDLAWQRIRESGATVDVCPRSDPQYALGDAIPAFQKAARMRHGERRGLRRARGQMRDVDAGQRSRYRHDPHGRDQPVSVQQRHWHGGRRSRYQERRHGDHRRRDSQIGRKNDWCELAKGSATDRRITQLPV
jgi:5-methylthioadenosine/S-adenosylhomocysteine deaminase